MDSQDVDFLKTLSVLYVEDEPVVREEGTVFLRRRVGDVRVASDGLAGLAAFKANPPRLVVTDIRMPGMDGLALAREIRALSPGVPIIITTAFEQTDYMLRAIRLGIDGYVIKPIHVDDFEVTLLACAHRLRTEEEAERARLLEAELLRMRHRAAVGVLTGGIAHDFNNLFQSVMNVLDLIRMRADEPGEVRRVLAYANQAAAQASVLGNRLRSIAEPSRRFDRVGPVDGLLRATVAEALHGCPITVELDLQAEGARVEHCEDDLLDVVRNLVLNAREAMPTGGTLRVSSRRRLLTEQDGVTGLAGPCVHVRLTDTGPGIPPEHLPLVFDPYFSTKTNYSQKGLGLGLALCEAVVRAHGGAIFADSKEGQGATFHVYLPEVAPA